MKTVKLFKFVLFSTIQSTIKFDFFGFFLEIESKILKIPYHRQFWCFSDCKKL